MGWYDAEPDSNKESGRPTTPCIFTSVTPAWSNANLVRLAEKIKSPLLFAHVRASTSGAVTEANCHPWKQVSGFLIGYLDPERKLIFLFCIVTVGSCGCIMVALPNLTR